MKIHPTHCHGHSRKTRLRHRSRRGFVLLYILVLIAIAGLLLVGITRDSLATATAAIDAEQALQQRWGTLSCQRTLLAQPALLLIEPRPENQPSSSTPSTDDRREEEEDEEEVDSLLARDISVRLGDTIYHLRIADESAKANVNTLLRHANRQGVSVAAELLANQQGNLLIQLPSSSGRTANGVQNGPLLQSWSQLFFPLPGIEYESWPLVLRDATDNLTCWGNGRLNFHQATEEALLAIAKLAVNPSQAKKLVQLRTKHPSEELNSLFDEIDLNHRQREQLDLLLTEESTCYSLWIDIHSPQRRQQRLAISTQRRSNRQPTILFQW